MNVLLGSTYAGNIDYFSCIKNADSILVDSFEFYNKQSFRNRCEIYGANGKLDLIIPVNRERGKKIMKDVKINYSSGWQKNHWKSLESCYRSSAFFEYYEHYFHELYFKDKPVFLLDFNTELQNLFIQLLKIETSISYTNQFQLDVENLSDHRTTIHPKKSATFQFNEKKYFQVFDSKYGFIPNLSIFDLLFNKGPEATLFL